MSEELGTDSGFRARPIPVLASDDRALAGRVLDQDPPQDGFRRPAHCLPSDRRRGQRLHPARNLARHRAGHHAPRGADRQRLRFRGQSRGVPPAAYRPSHSASRQCQDQTCILPRDALPSPRPYRTGSRQAEALQAHRPTLRQDCRQLRRLRRFCLRAGLGQIRPHGLVISMTNTSRPDR